jgi:hypothetical protein
MAKGAAPPSRYHVVQFASPVPGVVIAHVRRDDLTAEDGEGFSEMALFVLIEREGGWWLAAGQNTGITERSALYLPSGRHSARPVLAERAPKPPQIS